MKDVNGMKYTVFGLTNLVEIADHFSVSPGRNHIARGNVFERSLHRKAFRAAYVPDGAFYVISSVHRPG